MTTYQTLYHQSGLNIQNYEEEAESREYHACRFTINGFKVIGRQAKITPTKTGQFVTSWQRNKDGITEPFNEASGIDFLVIHVIKAGKMGQFIFPLARLIQKGIIHSATKAGKRGFRVYPPWDETTSKQAQKTQAWQLLYFVDLSDEVAGDFLKKTYANKTL
ncbi:MepB family protein [Putridiphycobacter roseus]|uniref:MepB family protein n=1 Tax=Putridiphycobacter roseus TaxID=2219161 RepID=UPI001F171A36|nr:MepB family protein [Putridiphycobacter roseus]